MSIRRRAVIYGCAGPVLTEAERRFFAEADPFGFILFARNVVDPEQLRRLTDDLRHAVGWQAPVLIDQEGGRVQRMRAPHWREWLPALDQMARARDPLRAQWIRSRLIAGELSAAGIDVNCAPLADLVEPETHFILRNRLYGGDVESVVAAARACAEGLAAGGVVPVLKHLPGYGRAEVDSHLSLPTVPVAEADLIARDFAPFRALADLPMGMTAHVVFSAIDAENPATTSPALIRRIRGEIGFSGLLMSDDLSMGALSGPVEARAAACLAAGCDVALHCNGELDEMEAIAAALGMLSAEAAARAEAALDRRGRAAPVDSAALAAELKALLT